MTQWPHKSHLLAGPIPRVAAVGAGPGHSRGGWAMPGPAAAAGGGRGCNGCV